jgi:hypothetical protein
VTRLVNGIDIEQNLVTISGSAEITDELANKLSEGGTFSITIRGRVRDRKQAIGGQHTKPREVFSLGLDALDELGEGEEVSGQMKIGADDAATPSDAD